MRIRLWSRLCLLSVQATLLVALVGCASQTAPAQPAAAPTTPPAAAAPTPTQQVAAPTATAVSQAAPTAAAVQPAAAKPTAPAAAAANPDAEWDQLVQAAKKEGELVVFLGRAGSRQLKDAFPVFEKKFGIKVTQVAGSGDDNADKVLAERSTGIFTGDVWMGGLTTINTRMLPASAFDPIEPQFILPEVKDRTAWFKGDYSWGDPDKKYTFLFAGSPTPLLAYNTNLVDDNEIKSFYDLLDPKWKGKIVSRDPASAGTGGNTAYFYFQPQLGKDFLRRLFTEQNVTVVDDARQAAEWLALGKYALYVLGSGNDIDEAMGQGLPVKDNYGPFKEGARIAAGGAGSISIFNKAAHPNAAKLFVNWWLSREGQLTAMTADPLDESLRTDIPADAVKADYRRKPGVDYSFLDAQPEVVANEDEMLAFMKGVIGR